ncbi:MAG TPA: histidine kinase [Ignavibacteriaceae bacterium]|nr:histidine kinase [Ignavibacteriaceae bacterium]
MTENPILNSPKSLNLYLLFWLLVAIVYFCLLYFGLNGNVTLSIADSLVFNILLCGLGLAFWYPVRFMSLESKLSKIVFNHLAAAILATAAWLAIGYAFIVYIINFGEQFKSFFQSTLVWRLLLGVLFNLLITSFYYIIIYYSNFKERAVRETELKNLVTEAELKNLKFQINPHFIFNSLNSMSALTAIDPDKAKSMILKLADFLRYTLANNEKQKNKLSDELKNIKLYLEIEKVRFEEKFEFVDNVSNECLGHEVPNMILQPLFENAIKHAVYETLNTVTLTLSGKIEGDYLVLSLNNNFEEESTGKKGAGIGLKNIANRLELIYGQKDLMKIEKGNNIFGVTLFIPV